MSSDDRRGTAPRRASERRRLAQLRHDLNNPVTVLFGAMAMLSATPLSDEQERWVKSCRSALDRMSTLIQCIDEGGEPAGKRIDESQRARLEALGVTRQLAKPFDRSALLAVLEEVSADPDRRLDILIVDDAVEISWLVSAFLENLPHRLTIAADGRAGCAMVKSGTFDLVLLDLDLPGLDGESALKSIREWERSGGRPPTRIVVMTGWVAETARTERQNPLARPDEDIAPLLPAFLANRREELLTLYEAAGANDYKRIHALGHRMKGTGRSYGLDGVSEIGASLEDAARREDADAVLECLENLTEYLHTVEVE
jgi:CheY-like chemotaxis protein